MTNEIKHFKCPNCELQTFQGSAFDPDAWVCLCGWRLPKAETRQFDTGATRDADTNKLDYEGFISPLVDRRFAEYMHTCRLRNIPHGQSIRSSDNWQKGIPKDQYAKSLVRHITEFRLLHDGFEAFDEKGNSLNLEEVLCAIRFNVDGYLFETLKERYGRNTVPRMSEG